MKKVIKLGKNSKVSFNEDGDLIIEKIVDSKTYNNLKDIVVLENGNLIIESKDPCNGVIYSKIYNELGDFVTLAIGTLKDYLCNHKYSKNTLLGEIYSFTGKQKIQIIKDAYIQGYKDALNKQIIELLTNEL